MKQVKTPMSIKVDALERKTIKKASKIKGIKPATLAHDGAIRYAEAIISQAISEE